MKENYNVIGVMSGTSLDGVDLAHILFVHQDKKWSYTIKETATIPYEPAWLDRLKSAIGYDENELALLNNEYTNLLGGIIRDFIALHDITGIDAVCSHGHTVLHQPHKGLTLQIGNLPHIAVIANQKVVCDFRVQDVALGGQGAPLVPIGDRLLFPQYTYCLNLGGFSNISFEEDGVRKAFDISPVNTVLNYYASQLGSDYDAGGAFAKSGAVVADMLSQLDALEFYAQKHPKSLGYEFVRETILPLMEKYNVSQQDKLATFTLHVATQIANAVKAIGKGKLLITGGGVYNDFLIENMRQLLPDTVIAIPDDKTIQFKEALIFALLGVLKLRGEINVLSSVTGAKQDHTSGYVYEP